MALCVLKLPAQGTGTTNPTYCEGILPETRAVHSCLQVHGWVIDGSWPKLLFPKMVMIMKGPVHPYQRMDIRITAISEQLSARVSGFQSAPQSSEVEGPDHMLLKPSFYYKPMHIDHGIAHANSGSCV